MIKYQEVLTFQLLHEYYEDGKCSDFQVLPDQKTQEWIKKMGSQFRQIDNVCHLILPKNLDLQETLRQTPDFKLTFNGKSSNPLFVNFTDIPTNELGYLLFTNESSELSSEFVEEDGIGLPNVVFEFSLASILKRKSSWPVTYSAQFKSRRTQWKYFLINKSLSPDFEIKLSGEGHELFSAPTTTNLVNGEAAILFDSGTNLIPIRQQSDIAVSAIVEEKKTPSSESKKITIPLPIASPNSFQIDKEEDRKERSVYSAIYVYL